MKFIFLFLFLLNLAFAADHTSKGTNYGQQGIETYASTRHGPDGALFLDPYFQPFLTNLEGQTLLDAGCGAGPWSIFAAKNGAVVYGVDIQTGMIQKAREAAAVENVSPSFEVGDVCELPYHDDFFDKAISINVGCNLPDLKKHIFELKRVLKKEGQALITAPTSFATLFTDGCRPKQEVIKSIDQILLHQDAFPKSFQNLDEVYRATFAKKEGKWALVRDATTLKSGESIWRKIPKMMVPNHYHSENEYLNLFKEAGFEIKEVYRPTFCNEHERLDYNKSATQTLGEEYVHCPAFAIFIVEKCSCS
jgi:ubiquinone/menaquinone biosynthesis C-methylase UbiE